MSNEKIASFHSTENGDKTTIIMNVNKVPGIFTLNFLVSLININKDKSYKLKIDGYHNGEALIGNEEVVINSENINFDDENKFKDGTYIVGFVISKSFSIEESDIYKFTLTLLSDEEQELDTATTRLYIRANNNG